MSENKRILVVIDKDLLDKVDDFRYDNRIPSRSETIRELVKKGLKAPKKKK